MKTKLNFLTLFFGITIISFIFWNRILRGRDILKLEPTADMLKLIFIILYIFVLITLIIYNVIQLLEIKFKMNENSKFRILIEALISNSSIQTVIIFFKETIIDSPTYIYNLFYNRFYIKDIVLHYGSYITLLLQKRMLLIYVLIFIMPRIIVSSCFLINIFVFNHFEFFYKSLILLSLPLIVRIILFIILDLVSKNILYMKQFFDLDFNYETQTLNISNKILDNINDITVQKKFNLAYITALYFICTENETIITTFYTL